MEGWDGRKAFVALLSQPLRELPSFSTKVTTKFLNPAFNWLLQEAVESGGFADRVENNKFGWD